MSDIKAERREMRGRGARREGEWEREERLIDIANLAISDTGTFQSLHHFLVNWFSV